MQDKNTFPAWHFNFRDREKLPDVKDIRRSALIRVTTIAITILLCGYLGFVEYQAYHWKIKMVKATAELAEKKPEDLRLLSLDKKLAEGIHISKALESLYVPSIDPVKLLMQISIQRPRNLVFNSITMDEKDRLVDGLPTRIYEVALDGFIRGGDDQGLLSMEAFEKALIKDDFFRDILLDFKVESLERAEEVDMLNFFINLQLKGSRDRG